MACVPLILNKDYTCTTSIFNIMNAVPCLLNDNFALKL